MRRFARNYFLIFCHLIWSRGDRRRRWMDSWLAQTSSSRVGIFGVDMWVLRCCAVRCAVWCLICVCVCDGAHSKLFRLSLTQIEVYECSKRLIDSMVATRLCIFCCMPVRCIYCELPTGNGIFSFSHLLLLLLSTSSVVVVVVVVVAVLLRSFFSFSFRPAQIYNLLIENFPTEER